MDGDGGIDVLVANKDERAHLLRNVVEGRGPALRLLVLEAGGAPALGARVSVRLGGRTVVRVVRTGYGYGSANEPVVHVGLGDDAPGAVSVTWVDGEEESFDVPQSPGAVVLLRRGSGR